MFPFQKTKLYRDTTNALKEILEAIEESNSPNINHIHKNILTLSEQISEITKPKPVKEQNELIKTGQNSIHKIASNLELTQLPHPIIEKTSSTLQEVEQQLINFPQTQKKVLILMARIGHGHLNASKATKEALEHLYGYDYDIEIIDFLEIISSRFKKTTEALFINGSKYLPTFNKFIFESTDRENLIKILDRINYPFLANKLKTFFEEKNPDLIISTFPPWDNIIQEVCIKHHKPTKFINIITDSINIHRTWIQGNHDYHIVANEDTANTLKQLKVPNKKIKTLGFPIRLKYLEKKPHQEFCQQNQISPKKPFLLYLAMAERSSTAIKRIQEMQKLKDLQIIIITGRNKKLLPKLKEKFSTPNIHTFGWVDNLHEFIQHSEIIITKAGGSTVMEAIALKKPLIITKVIAGQEEGNAELIERHNLGVVLNSKNTPKTDLTTAIKHIQKNKKQITNNLSKLSNPEASLKIAEFINQL